MEFSIFKMIENFIREKKFKRKHFTILVAMALVVALTTAGALKLTGVTRTRELTTIKCPVDVHRHVEACYDGENNLVCGYADFVVHTHTLDCYYDDVLTCELPVIEAHTHTEDCYISEEYLVFGEELSAEAHTHTDACYTETMLLTCEQEESEAHTHTEECYTARRELICRLEESGVHVSADNCYKVRKTLVCEKEEILLHTHTEECFEAAVFDENGRMVALGSRLPADAAIPDSWTWAMVPACGQLQIEEHVHGAGCLDTVKLTPSEAKDFVSNLAESAQNMPSEADRSNAWSGTKKSTDQKSISDGEKTVKEQFTWVVAVNFPDDAAWETFTYTDLFRQTMTCWTLQEGGEKAWTENHPIHQYGTLSRLDGELRTALNFWLAGAGLKNEITYTISYKDQNGNTVEEANAEVCSFEIRFAREAGENLVGKTLTFGYTSLVDTADFVDNTDYTVGSDFTLPDFTGEGSVCFQYTAATLAKTDTGKVTVRQLWQDINGRKVSYDLPDSVDVVLKKYAFKGGIYRTEAPKDPDAWCKLVLHITGADAEKTLAISSLSGETLGESTAPITLFVPRNALVELRTDDPENDGWRYTVDLKDVAGCELTVTVEADTDEVFLNVIGNAPAGFASTGDFEQWGEIITLRGDTWSYEWDDLLFNDGDTQYVYIVEDVEIPEGYYTTVADDGNGNFTVINQKQMKPGTITVEVKWLDENGKVMVQHPESAAVELQKLVDGEWVTVEGSSLTVTDGLAAWTDLEDGEYRVVEKDSYGFAVVYSYTVYDSQGNKESSMKSLSGNTGTVTILNIDVHAEEGEIVVVKIWEDDTPGVPHGKVKIVIKRAKPAEDTEPETSEPVTSETEPNTSEPVTSETEPNTSEPVTSETEPNTSEPVTSETEPNTSEPVTSETEPNTSEPVTSETEPNTSEPVSSETEPKTTEPESSETEPVTSEPVSSETEPNTTDPTPTESNPTESNPTESSPNESNPTTTTPSEGTPSTGDESHLMLYVIAALVSGCLLLSFTTYSIGLYRLSKKKGK